MMRISTLVLMKTKKERKKEEEKKSPIKNFFNPLKVGKGAYVIVFASL